jgi:DNA-directed RNA polymerase specialized sigma24 family protein
MEIGILRELFRNIQQFKALYESEGLDMIYGPNGEEVSLWDLLDLYKNLTVLPKRQHQAIELYLVQNMRETDAAVKMGLSPTNPIGIYATVGLQKLIALLEEGAFVRVKVGGNCG